MSESNQQVGTGTGPDTAQMPANMPPSKPKKRASLITVTPISGQYQILGLPAQAFAAIVEAANKDDGPNLLLPPLPANPAEGPAPPPPPTYIPPARPFEKLSPKRRSFEAIVDKHFPEARNANDPLTVIAAEEMKRQAYSCVVCGFAEAEESEIEMIMCDAEDTEVLCCNSWFHVACTGMTRLPPADKDWICQVCAHENKDALQLRGKITQKGQPIPKSGNIKYQDVLEDDEDSVGAAEFESKKGMETVPAADKPEEGKETPPANTLPADTPPADKAETPPAEAKETNATSSTNKDNPKLPAEKTAPPQITGEEHPSDDVTNDPPVCKKCDKPGCVDHPLLQCKTTEDYYLQSCGKYWHAECIPLKQPKPENAEWVCQTCAGFSLIHYQKMGLLPANLLRAPKDGMILDWEDSEDEEGKPNSSTNDGLEEKEEPDSSKDNEEEVKPDPPKDDKEADDDLQDEDSSAATATKQKKKKKKKAGRTQRHGRRFFKPKGTTPRKRKTPPSTDDESEYNPESEEDLGKAASDKKPRSKKQPKSSSAKSSSESDFSDDDGSSHAKSSKKQASSKKKTVVDWDDDDRSQESTSSEDSSISEYLSADNDSDEDSYSDSKKTASAKPKRSSKETGEADKWAVIMEKRAKTPWGQAESTLKREQKGKADKKRPAAASSASRPKVLTIGGKAGTYQRRDAFTHPQTASQQMDAIVRDRLKSTRRPMEKLMNQSLPITKSIEFKPELREHRELAKKEAEFPWVIHGSFCITQQAPNNDGGGRQQKPNMHDELKMVMWVGSPQAQEAAAELFARENRGNGPAGFALSICPDYESYAAFFTPAPQDEAEDEDPPKKHKKKRRQQDEAEDEEPKKKKGRRSKVDRDNEDKKPQAKNRRSRRNKGNK